MKIKDKFTQLWLWMKGYVKGKDGRFSKRKTFLTGVALYSSYCFIVWLLTPLKFTISCIYIVLPYIIQFLECLISALSYSLHKKEFFYGIQR